MSDKGAALHLTVVYAPTRVRALEVARNLRLAPGSYLATGPRCRDGLRGFNARHGGTILVADYAQFTPDHRMHLSLIFGGKAQIYRLSDWGRI